MRFLSKVILGAAMALGLAFPTMAAERAIIVLDGSGSMWAQIEGKARITIARETLSEVLAELPDDLELGLMTYGHREKGNCEDIELLVPPASGAGPAIAAAAEGINPKGMTPISDAVRLAAEDLQYTEEKATVILITDGLETCEVDPCQLASDLEQQGIDFTTHVLGFGLSDEEGQEVACLAENTGGKYLSAADGAGLVDALTRTVAEVVQAEAVAEPEPAPQPEPTPAVEYNLKPTVSLSEGGPDLERGGYEVVWSWYKPNADGTEGEHVGTDYYADFEGDLEPGDYILKAEVGYAAVSQPVSIVDGKVAAPHFVMNAAVLKLHPRPSEGADADGNAALEIRHDGEYVTTQYGDKELVVPAGALEVDVSIGEGKVTRSYEAKAGEVIDEDVIVGVGLAFFTTEYVPGQAVEDDIFMEVFDAKTALDGTRNSVAYNYGGEQDFTLPAGSYVLAYSLDGTKGEIPFDVATGERTDVAIVLDAGVLNVVAPNGDYIEVLSAKPDIAGNRESFDYGFGPEWMTTLKAGDYLVRTDKNDATSETALTITAGERFELSIEAKPAKTKTK
ncbi:Ca-activated chloride channel family protein [Devosia lucknowensis]|uniref:Ca-activated chloride channel family protein n=1 Tax=Devosia lucknowensis TaxID=1096929 RepID=A0A1Y6EUM2_9HYPH|nr:VWA domain-containing protein [Devosia lucknowensis]SMQ66405.1 Ca-activated chloride channel family protein [Devosia lucknowensis]